MHLQKLRVVIRQEQILVNFVLEKARKLELYFDFNLIILLVYAYGYELMVGLLDCQECILLEHLALAAVFVEETVLHTRLHLCDS